MRVTERLSSMPVHSRQLRADGRGRADETSDDDGPTCPGSLIVVSNRQPYRHEYEDDEPTAERASDPADTDESPPAGTNGGAQTGTQRSITVDEPTGGLTAGLDPVVQATDGTWIAWGDGDADFAVTDEQNCVAVPPDERRTRSNGSSYPRRRSSPTTTDSVIACSGRSVTAFPT